MVRLRASAVSRGEHSVKMTPPQNGLPKFRLRPLELPQHVARPNRLVDLIGFGSNPGALRARCYIPADLPPNAPLVVVLHGCTQTAGDYDNGSGWSRLADQQGFALLFPEQQRANNPNLCFNWFVPEDIGRDGGEALSIRQMVDTLVRREELDSTRIFVTGLSAGGAMAAVMLATYPEVFAAGGVIAGLPYGSASTIPEAFDRMRGMGMPSKATLLKRVHQASSHRGPWPRLSVWHGTADHIVAPANARALTAIWAALHDLDDGPRITIDHGFPRRIWCDRQGREVIEEYTITGMAHGLPIDVRGSEHLGEIGSYMLDVGISSTRRLAEFWGLAEQELPARVETASISRQADLLPPNGIGGYAPAATRLGHHASTSGIRKVIEDALRSAGLMR